MSFIVETFEIPLWLLIFVFVSAVPLWIGGYKKFVNKFIVGGILKRKLRKSAKIAEDEVDLIKKATDNWNTNAEENQKEGDLNKARQRNPVNSADQPYIKIVLKTLALKGDAGMLIQSIADSLNIKTLDIKGSLKYLEENEFVEVVDSGTGTKYYLAPRGKRYCIKRGYITE